MTQGASFTTLWDELGNEPYAACLSLPNLYLLAVNKERSSSKKWLWTLGGIAILIPHLIFIPSLPSVILRRGAPFVRTKAKTLETTFDTLQNHISFKGKTFIDLGSGDGIAVIAAAKRGFAVSKGYGLEPIMQRLGKKLEKDLQPGSFVVSNLFQFPEWKPYFVSATLYVYKTPMKQ